MNVLELEGIRDLKDLSACRVCSGGTRLCLSVKTQPDSSSLQSQTIFFNTQLLQKEVALWMPKLFGLDGLKHMEECASGQQTEQFEMNYFV